jgi:uncharacterized protein (TIGR02270 family)
LIDLRERDAVARRGTLGVLGDYDESLSAHLDGVVAGDARAQSLCDVALPAAPAAAFFIRTIDAIRRKQYERVQELIRLSETAPEGLPAIRFAFGWVEPDHLRGIVTRLLTAPDAVSRCLGICACASHGANPGPHLQRLAEEDPHPHVRARALKAAAELGRLDLVPACARTVKHDDDASCREWAVWSAVSMGERGTLLDALRHFAIPQVPLMPTALQLALQAMSANASRSLLQTVSTVPEHLEVLIEGSGISGDPAYVPWLLNHIDHPDLGTSARDAFVLITGAALVEVEHGVDVAQAQRWWDTNKPRFTPGQRYFMGAPVTREHCIAVLKNGYQRQRILAAHYLCLLEPGTPLFNTSAPAWRQQRLLAGMN